MLALPLLRRLHHRLLHASPNHEQPWRPAVLVVQDAEPAAVPERLQRRRAAVGATGRGGQLRQLAPFQHCANTRTVNP